jgi:acyl-CoA thioester hydrolase
LYTHEVKKRVLYGETDQMGYLYYGNYCLLYEMGRGEAVRALGISYKELEDDYKIMMPVISVESRYLISIKYDELITIRTILEEMPTKLIHFKHEIYTEDGRLAHKGEVKLFFIDVVENKRISTPNYLSEKLIPFFAKNI